MNMKAQKIKFLTKNCLISINIKIMKTTIKINKMKKLAIVLLIAITPIFSFAQSSLFEKYEDMDDVSTVVVTKHMFRLMSKIAGDNEEAKEYKDMVLGLNNLTVYTTENDGIALNMKKDAKMFLQNAKMFELVRVKDKEANVKIYAREGKDEDHVSELFMFISAVKNVAIDGRNPKAVIVSFTGDIDLNKISEISNKFNIPGGKHLKNAKK